MTKPNTTTPQCPNCKMLFPGRGGGHDKHANGTTCWGDSVPILTEETKAIWKYWKEKKSHGTPNKQFLLSATDMLQLLNDASITANDIGRQPHQYQLARYNDTGDYEMGNCRFTTRRENRAEQKSTKGIPKGRRA